MCWSKLDSLSILTPKKHSCCLSFMSIKSVVGTVKPKCFSANSANAGEIVSDKAFAWYILCTYLITLDLLDDINKVFYSIDRRAISIVLSKQGVSELLIANVM